MWTVYIYIGFLLISHTEPYWNINSNEIEQYYPWNSIYRKLNIWQNLNRKMKQIEKKKYIIHLSIKVNLNKIKLKLNFNI